MSIVFRGGEVGLINHHKMQRINSIYITLKTTWTNLNYIPSVSVDHIIIFGDFKLNGDLL